MKQLRTLKSFKIFKSEIKKLKTYSGSCAFKGLSNDTTLMQIQSGRTVPLKCVVFLQIYLLMPKNCIEILQLNNKNFQDAGRFGRVCGGETLSSFG
jgi:hypothetical protein